MIGLRGVGQSNNNGSGSTLHDLGIPYRLDGPIEQRLPCPRCDRGPRDDALGVNIETGAFHCFRCGWSGRAATGETRAPQPIMRADDPTRAKRVLARLRSTWKASCALDQRGAAPVRRYLEVRGLASILADTPQALRAHPGLAYFDGFRERGLFPAMLALLSDRNGDGISLHATYLQPDGSGKAPVPSPKKVLGVPTRGATKGGAIRLYQPVDGVLGIAEGIESALSLRVIQRIPVWSAFCADNLAAVRLPRLRELHIGVDVDESGKGESAARHLAHRMTLRHNSPRVMLVFPDGDGPRDLNDELRRRVN